MTSSAKRSRVPFSCLICKKRKIKCDRIKPACGSCIKSGVPHMCEYVIPPWSSEIENGSASSSAGSQYNISPKQNEDIETMETIRRQRKEIDDLKRKLALSKQESAITMADRSKQQQQHQQHITSQDQPNLALIPLQPQLLQVLLMPSSVSKCPINHDSTQRRKDAIKTDLSILTKLCSTKQQFTEIQDDLMFTITKKRFQNYTNVNSWISIIRLDPQLNNLWYKIINLQKIYLLHKLKSLKRISDMLPQQAPKLNPDAKCPVMQIDLKVVTKQSPLLEIHPMVQKEFKLCQANIKTEIEKLYTTFDDNGFLILQEIQGLWNSMLSALREEKLNYNQVHFLLNLFFQSEPFKYQSSGLLMIYKNTIFNLVRKGEDNSALLNKTESRTADTETNFDILKLTGVYAVMLVLIIEECLNCLRSRLHMNEISPTMIAFRALFPNEVVLLGLGDKETPINLKVSHFLTRTIFLRHESSVPDFEYFQKSPIKACCIMCLNNSIQRTGKFGNNPAVDNSFSAILPLFLQSLIKCEDLKIWTNPQTISIISDDGNINYKKTQEFQVHISLLWKDTIRIVNIVTFSLIPLITVGDQLGGYLYQICRKIAKSEYNHIEFLRKELKTEPDSVESISFGASYVINRTFKTLAAGINGDEHVGIDNIKQLIVECGVWVSEKDDVLHIRDGAGNRGIEEQVMLHYLRLFLTYLVLLQEEEESFQTETKTSPSANSNKFVGIIQKICSMIALLKRLISRVKVEYYCSYVLLIVIEMMTRIIPIVSAIIIRIGDAADPTAESNIKLLGTIEDNFPHFKSTCVNVSSKLIELVNSTMNDLKGIVSNLNDRILLISKVWNFYIVFIKHIHKISYKHYAKIHENVPIFNIKVSGNCPVVNIHEKNGGADTFNLTKSEGANSNSSNIINNNIINNSNKSTGKCPIDFKSFSGSLGKCPIEGVSTPSNERGVKRRCPFDHESPGFKNSKINPKESNIRGGNQRMTPTPPPVLQNLPGMGNSPLLFGLTPVHSPKPILAPVPFSSTGATISSQVSLNSVKSDEERYVELLPGILNDFADLDFDFDSNLAFDFNSLQSDDPPQNINQLFP